MIHTQQLTIGGRALIRTWSDTNYIERDGQKYVDAVDPADSGREYTETADPLPDRALTDSEALSLIRGGDAMKASEAKQFRALVEQGAASLTDQEVSTAPEVLPRLHGDGRLVKAGTRVYWDGQIKRAASDLWDTAANAPDAAPALWEDVLYRQGIRIIPETITAGAAFAKGERGWWGDTLYESLLDANVWTPAQNPEGWTT